MVDLQEQVVENDDQRKCEDGIAIDSSMFIVDSRTSRDGIAVRAYRDHSLSAPAPTTNDFEIMNDKIWPTSIPRIDMAREQLGRAQGA
jgi:hypothetical protein